MCIRDRDNGGRLDTSCWGGILANGAKMKGVSGVVIDGACPVSYTHLGFHYYNNKQDVDKLIDYLKELEMRAKV